jgi:hypothetical protein
MTDIKQGPHLPVGGGLTNRNSTSDYSGGNGSAPGGEPLFNHETTAHDDAVLNVDFAEILLDALGHRDGEYSSLLYAQTLNRPARSEVLDPGDAVSRASELADTQQSVWFGVNPTAGPARRGGGRGRNEAATRIAAAVADVDIKEGACPTPDVADAVIADLSILLGSRPSVIINSGAGKQPIWPIADGDDPAAGRKILARWGRAVDAVAARHNITLDKVADAARVLRVPGSYNHKYGEPRLVTAVADTGRPLDIDEIAERLDEWGIGERAEDHGGSSEPISPPTEWKWAETTCPYVAKMIGGLAKDIPKGGRNPWLLSQRIRLLCAHRLGCITKADWLAAEETLRRRFAEIVADPRYGQPREVKRLEHQDTGRCAIRKVAAKTDEQVRKELYDHSHFNGGGAEDFFGTGGGAQTGNRADGLAAGPNETGVPAKGGRGSGGARRASIQWAAEIQPERQIWLWENRIPVGTLSALSGRGGTGKTTYALHVAAQLSHGTLPGEYLGDPRPVLLWSGEDQWSTVLVPRLIAAGADLAKIGRLTIESVEVDGEVAPRFPLDAEVLRVAIAESGAGMVIIDPIASTMAGADLHREADVRAALDTLAAVAAATGTVVMYVRHFGKGAGNASDKMSGSHAFRDAARSVFLFAEDKESRRVVVTQDKGNYSQRGEESFAFRLENVIVPTGSGDVGMAKVVELGSSEESVEDIINRQPERDDDVFGEQSAAQDWLTDHFAQEGLTLLSKNVKDAAQKAGIAVATLKRAKLKLRIKDVSQGFPRKTLWVWPGGEPTEPTTPRARKLEPTEPTEPTVAERGERNESIEAKIQSAQSAQALGSGDLTEPTEGDAPVTAQLSIFPTVNGKCPPGTTPANTAPPRPGSREEVRAYKDGLCTRCGVKPANRPSTECGDCGAAS